MGTIDLHHIHHRLGYTFQNNRLLELALTHKSYANELCLDNEYGNERLEFMGDAVLGTVISHIIMEKHPDYSEGELSKMRASVVNKRTLADILKQLNISRYIFLGKGEEECSGRQKASILANVYEAVIAAVYFDGGYESAFKMIQEHFKNVLAAAEKEGALRHDYKSQLQEYCQKYLNTLPKYIIENEAGPDHIKIFESSVYINNIRYERGSGTNKKSAEQEAARKTLTGLFKEIK